MLGVLVIGAVGATVVVGYMLLSVGSLKTGLVEQQAARARHLADACAEEGVWQVSLDLTYAGGDTLSFTDGSCQIIDVTGSGNTNRVVQASGTVGTAVRRVEVDIATVQPAVVLNDWQEVATF